MTLEKFIADFESAIEDVESGSLCAETRYRELEEWDSLAVLTVIAMVDAEYDCRLKAKELKQLSTLSELHDLIVQKLSS